MRELIYKDEAYKAIDNCIRDGWDRISPADAKMNIHHLVSDADEEWIPCEERLPNKHEDKVYLVCDSKGRITLSNFDLNGKWVTSSFFDVIAWRPLPKPYEGARE